MIFICSSSCLSIFICLSYWITVSSFVIYHQPRASEYDKGRSTGVQLIHDHDQVKPIENARSPTVPPIIACSSTTEVMRAISMYIQPNETVLELGSQLSQVSTHLCQTVGSDGTVVLVDVKRSDAKSGRTLHRSVQDFLHVNNPSKNDNPKFYWASFLELEHFHQWRTSLYFHQDVSKPIHFSAMILDIAASIGNDLHMTALTLADEFMYQQQTVSPFEYRLKVIIVKSRNLSSLARRLVHSQRLFDSSVSLPQNLYRTHDPYIIPTVGVEEYRRTIPMVVQSGDSCLEVGCHFGRTTLALYNAAVTDATKEGGFCIGVDIGPKIIQHAKNELPHIPFAVADAWRVMDLIQLRQLFHKDIGRASESSLGYDIVYADLGGLSGPDGLLESIALVDALARGLEPRIIVIKSLCLNRLSSRLKALSNEWQKLKKYS